MPTAALVVTAGSATTVGVTVLGGQTAHVGYQHHRTGEARHWARGGDERPWWAGVAGRIVIGGGCRQVSVSAGAQRR